MPAECATVELPACCASASLSWCTAGGTASQKNSTNVPSTMKTKEKIASGSGTRWRRSHSTPGRIAAANVSASNSSTMVVWFTCWIGFGVEKYPYGLLTMIVSLEAIFLSTFVLISQNRADAKRQVIADEHWRLVGEEKQQNVELLVLSNQILALTREVRALVSSVEKLEPPE